MSVYWEHTRVGFEDRSLHRQTRRGREIFQQKNICDRKCTHGPHHLRQLGNEAIGSPATKFLSYEKNIYFCLGTFDGAFNRWDKDVLFWGK